MAFKLPEPPDWWVKYKPLRWVLAVLVAYWIFGTLLPRYRTESGPPARPTFETSDEAIPEIAVAPEPVTEPALPPLPPEPVRTEPPPPTATPVTPAPAPPATRVEPKPETEPVTVDPAARFTQVEATRVTLINGLRSYDSVETLQALLETAGHTTQIQTIQKDVPRNRYPPYRNDSLVVDKYRHGDFEGRLTLEFFNDRLYQAHFVPVEADGYLAWLRRSGVPLERRRGGRTSVEVGDLRISSNIDFSTSEVGRMLPSTPFVLWEDQRLVQQMKDWGPLR